MLVCITFFWFFIYSVFGWIYETTYCTVTERKWMNRGFLYGPYCPIYGVGIVSIMALWHYAQANQDLNLEWWQVFLASFFGSIVLEYFTSWALEKLFNARWWDYSNMPLNVNGRICLPASILFGLGGLLVVYVLYDPTYSATKAMGPNVIELFALLFVATIAADTAITVSALQSFAETASTLNNNLNEYMENLVAVAVERGDVRAQAKAERKEELAQSRAERISALRDRLGLPGEFEPTSNEPAEIEREFEAYAAMLRDRSLANMSHYVRSAARRAKVVTAVGSKVVTPGGEQFVKMMRDVREKRWQKAANLITHTDENTDKDSED